VITDLYHLELESGDSLVLCSDGLSNQVSAEEIGRITRSSSRTVEICETLIGEALQTGAPDNVTVVAIKVRSPEADLRQAASDAEL